MAYTFSKADLATLTIQDIRPLVQGSFNKLLQNMKFPVEAKSNTSKREFLEQLLQSMIANPATFVMKIMDDDLTVSYSIGFVSNGIYNINFTFLGPNKLGSLSWAFLAEVSQSRCDFLISEGVDRVRCFFTPESNIPAAMAQLTCYQVETSETQIGVTPNMPGWSFTPFDRTVITYLLVDPSSP